MIIAHWLTLIRAGIDSVVSGGQRRARHGASSRFQGLGMAPAYAPVTGRRHLPVMRRHLRSRQRLG